MPKRLTRAQYGWLALAALVLLATLLRTLALALCFDAQIGYFQAASALPILTYIAEVLILGLCAAIPFRIIIGAHQPHSAAPTTLEMVGCSTTALLLLLSGCYLLIKGRTDVSAPAMLTVLAALLSILGAGFFVARLLSLDAQTRSLLGYALIFAAALLLIIAYFDRYTQMNAPHKLSQHVCMLAMMLAVLFEIRALIGRNLPKLRIACHAFAFAACTVFGLSNTLGFLLAAYDDLTYLFFDLPALGFGIYSAAKCLELALSEGGNE